MHRELDGEGYIVVINVAGSEERVSLSTFATPTNELTVATAAPNSRFDVGWAHESIEAVTYLMKFAYALRRDEVQKNNVTLGLYDAVIFSFQTAEESTTVEQTTVSTTVGTDIEPTTTEGAASVVLSLTLLMVAVCLAIAA